MTEFTLPPAIDLHESTVHAGYNKTLMFLRLHKANSSAFCKIITGRSGKMKNEFPKWVEGHLKPYVESYKEFDNRGSFIVKVRYENG